MHNGLPSFTSSARTAFGDTASGDSSRLRRARAVVTNGRRAASWVRTAGYCVVGMSLAALITGVRPVVAQEAIAQDLPDLSTDETPVAPPSPTVTPDPNAPTIEDLLPSEQPADAAAPAADPAVPQQPPASVQVVPVLREPTITPSPEPRYDPPLIVNPNAVVRPTISRPAFNDYHLGPGDGIFVSVQRYPDLSFQATLDLQGNVIVPLEGSVNLEGLTLDEASAALYEIYNGFVVLDDGQFQNSVDITLVALRGVEVTILGAVQRPGFYPLADPSVATALLTAGGATRTSDLRAIQVQRQRRRGDGIVEETVNVDLFTPLKEGSPLPDVRLEDGDVVVIPELDPSQLDEYDSYLVARSTLAQPIINVRFLNYAGGRGGIGTLNLNNGSSFLDAVSLLGINPDNANLGDVALIRYDPESGQAVTVSLDAKSAVMGDITQNPPLQDSDVIVVGRNLIGRISFALRTVTRPFRDVLGFSNFFDDLFNDGLFDNNNN